MAQRLISHIPSALLAALGLLAIAATGFALLAMRTRRARQAAEHAALTDPLTGLANRPAFYHRLAVEWERAIRYERPIGVIVLDLDGFKEVNDAHGHAAGDEVLRQVGAGLGRRIRASDLVARLGGDEFAVLAPETPGPGLAALAELVRGVVDGLPVGVSTGWAEREHADPEARAMVCRADEAMYANKARRASASPRVSGPAPAVAVGALPQG
ncbi:MAG: GGDEF domain-containing protein [Actinomycetota bacterium]|nr:GGDEF domain-containing protein [Actinomycetota bacterium]